MGLNTDGKSFTPFINQDYHRTDFHELVFSTKFVKYFYAETYKIRRFRVTCRKIDRHGPTAHETSFCFLVLCKHHLITKKKKNKLATCQFISTEVKYLYLVPFIYNIIQYLYLVPRAFLYNSIYTN
jgi:hypothetical protein